MPSGESTGKSIGGRSEKWGPTPDRHHVMVGQEKGGPQEASDGVDANGPPISVRRHERTQPKARCSAPGIMGINSGSTKKEQAAENSQPWSDADRPLVTNRWKPGDPLRVEASSKVRMWIRLPELPMEMWNTRLFNDVADMVGATYYQRFGFARLLVQVPIGFTPISEVALEVDDDLLVSQFIEYESKLKYLSHLRFLKQ
ncbi:hypothetical protein EJ110_NYTH32774 [Nymphaea thermarum]|nr:hypothetical protein EJ110_NYTH32774 [Nymphaea thermarum]